MLSTNLQNSIKLAITPLAIVAVILGSFCVGMSHKPEVAMENMNTAGVAVVQSEQTCCGGSISKHVQFWTSTFLTIPREGRDMLTLFALGPLFAFMVVRSIFAQKPSHEFNFSYRQYLRHCLNLFALQPLRLAFARGILNTKVY